jgi:chromosome segregation ATPase
MCVLLRKGWLQEEKEKVGDLQAEHRSRLRHQDDLMHEVQTRIVSLSNSIAEKKEELDTRAEAADPLSLEAKTMELQRVVKDLEGKKASLANAREKLQQQQNKADDKQAELDKAEREAVRSEWLERKSYLKHPCSAQSVT